MDDIRHIQSDRLTKAQIDSLDGATVFDPDDLDDAIISTYPSLEGMVAVYDYDLLVDLHIDQMEEDEDPDYDAHTAAAEWVNYNTIRAVPYMRPRGPIIVQTIEDEAYEDDETIVVNGKQVLVIERGCALKEEPDGPGVCQGCGGNFSHALPDGLCDECR